MKKYLIYLMATGYIVAGILHFAITATYAKLLEGFLPYPQMLVYISGIAEILCGIGLCIPATRKAAAWGTILLLIAVFPANINMAMHYERWNIGPAIPYARLPLQLLLIWWAYVYTKD